MKYLIAILPLLIGIFLTCYLWLRPTTWYVDCNALVGGDGRTKQNAFRTITEAVEAASSGDTIRIATGTYKESVAVEKDRLSFIGEQPGVTWLAPDDEWVIKADGASRLHLENFRF